MVSGVELIPFFLEFGPTVYGLISKLIMKKGASNFKSKLKIVNSILAEMKPLEAMKQVEVTKAGPAGIPEELKQLMQTVEEGNQLVHKSKNQKDLEEWIDSFMVSLSIAMFKVHLRTAVNVKEIKQQLLPNRSPQIHFHLYFSEEKHKVGFQKFIDCVNMPSGSKPLLQGVESVRTDKNKTNESKEQKQSVPQASKVVPCNQIPKNVNNHNPTDDINQSEPVLKKVVYEVLARDDYGEKIVQKAVRNVKGVVCAERVVQDNQERDLVIVIATEIFVVQDMKNYLKTKLKRKHVYVKEK
ncbi:hypothetical protein L6164_028885 [Bauhinia variegata]|uniref:Uncharacterized protein n=1 Tax=Bauhinia variegata TaxID=167791 RepID=A0ACB9L7B1_BAUVA|nr:hypothetical protein L6164_028885 [Bauhinia variegata]